MKKGPLQFNLTGPECTVHSAQPNWPAHRILRPPRARCRPRAPTRRRRAALSPIHGVPARIRTARASPRPGNPSLPLALSLSRPLPLSPKSERRRRHTTASPRPPTAPRPATVSTSSAGVYFIYWRPQVEPEDPASPSPSVCISDHRRLFLDSGGHSAATKPPTSPRVLPR
jgi:hypothetical protein